MRTSAGVWPRSAMPTVVTMTSDGRVRLEFNNPRPDELGVLLKARLM